jgi:hypothetical protein
MIARIVWILPAIFIAIGVIYALSGEPAAASLYLALALGMTLYGLGVRRGVAPMQWFGAAIAGFALVILLWLTFGR